MAVDGPLLLVLMREVERHNFICVIKQPTVPEVARRMADVHLGLERLLPGEVVNGTLIQIPLPRPLISFGAFVTLHQLLRADVGIVLTV